MIDIKILNVSNNNLPAYETEGSAGMDLKASINDVILPAETALIGTGLYIEIPVGYEAQIRPRSGLAIKQGITVLNSPGTIDSDYRGEIGIIIHNTSSEAFQIREGDRIAQMVISPVVQANWIPVENISELIKTNRADGGFGSTGTN